jgi:hypothetical protein
MYTALMLPKGLSLFGIDGSAILIRIVWCSFFRKLFNCAMSTIEIAEVADKRIQMWRLTFEH